MSKLRLFVRSMGYIGLILTSMDTMVGLIDDPGESTKVTMLQIACLYGLSFWLYKAMLEDILVYLRSWENSRNE